MNSVLRVKTKQKKKIFHKIGPKVNKKGFWILLNIKKNVYVNQSYGCQEHTSDTYIHIYTCE